MASRARADALLVEQGLAESTERAQALILAGVVHLPNGERVAKAGQLLPDATELRIKGDTNPYVSRGGLKLERALQAFQINVTNLSAMDVGASTGGFTDCLLQHGAKRVFAVDVGHNLLAWSIRSDTRVEVIERINARALPPALISEPVDVITIDVSFISLKLILPSVLGVAAPGCVVVALVKPQFEVARDEVGAGGIVRDADARNRARDRIKDEFASHGLVAINSIESPILGNKGNVEYLMTGCVPGVRE